MAIDPRTFRAKLSTGTGGLSGPAIKPIAVRCVWQVHRALGHIPIIGMGGIATVDDAIEMILAGATAVAIGTANFYEPAVSEQIARGLADFCDMHGITSLEEIRGQVKIEG
jgi:dihydroorotate dehydrogenase (NAD+) catalytic subunit